MKRTWELSFVVWWCVAALIWGILLFILISQISEWPRSVRALQLIYEQAVVNPEWNHTVQGDPLSSTLKGILVQVLIIHPVVFLMALAGLLFFTASAFHWKRRCDALTRTCDEEARGEDRPAD